MCVCVSVVRKHLVINIKHGIDSGNMRSNHHWLYTRINNDGTINKDFVDGVENFISFACKFYGIKHGEQYLHATSTNFECNIHEKMDT